MLTVKQAISSLIESRDKFSDVEDWLSVDEIDIKLQLCYEAEPQDICTLEFSSEVLAISRAI